MILTISPYWFINTGLTDEEWQLWGMHGKYVGLYNLVVDNAQDEFDFMTGRVPLIVSMMADDLQERPADTFN